VGRHAVGEHGRDLEFFLRDQSKDNLHISLDRMPNVFAVANRETPFVSTLDGDTSIAPEMDMIEE